MMDNCERSRAVSGNTAPRENPGLSSDSKLFEALPGGFASASILVICNERLKLLNCFLYLPSAVACAGPIKQLSGSQFIVLFKRLKSGNIIIDARTALIGFSAWRYSGRRLISILREVIGEKINQSTLLAAERKRLNMADHFPFCHRVAPDHLRLCL
jgi:hypothetical protein